MSMSQMSVSLRFRQSSVPGKKGSLYIRFIRKRYIKTITTPYRIYAEEWNEKLSYIRTSSSFSSREKELREIAYTLDKEIEDLCYLIRQTEYAGECSLDDAVMLYRKKYFSYSFSSCVDELITEMTPPRQSRLAEAYRSASNNLKAFNGGKDISLNSINARFMRAYEVYMKNKGNSMNTISFYNRNTRAIYNKAVRQGWTEWKKEDPFADVFTGVAKTRKRAVKQDVIDNLIKLDLSINDSCKKAGSPDSLSFARDIFILSFLMRGISFIDLAFLRKTDIRHNLITYIRHKTGQRIEIAVTPAIREIILRYTEYTKNTEYLLPILPKECSRLQYKNRIRQQNRNLKILSQMIGLEVPLTTYVSRHSWASIARAKGFSVSVICQGLGHESEKTTQIYLDSFDYSILHKANKIITDFAKKVS